MMAHTLAAAAVLALLAVAGCNPGDGGGPAALALPPRLGGLPLTGETAGEDARREIGRLHGKGVAPVASLVGVYGAAPDVANLYVSRFGSEVEARRQRLAMADRIGDGSSGFDRHTTFTVAGTRVHSVVGHGQVHYFYARRSDLVWISAPPRLGRAALAGVLGVAETSIPAREAAAPAR